MDAIDRKILSELQADGRLTLTDLAERISLSVSPCHRRVRALEQSGAIVGYRAQLDRHVLGLEFESLVFVTMRSARREVLDGFEGALLSLPNVVQAQRLFGNPDYMLRVVTRDLTGFQSLYDTSLATLPGVERLTSTLVMKSIVEGRSLPL